MKKILLAILTIFLTASLAMAGPPSGGGSGTGVKTASECNAAAYYAIGTLCQDTDDGKLYKGNGTGVTEVAAGSAINDTAYNATSWDTNTDAPTKNAVRDKFVTVDASLATKRELAPAATALTANSGTPALTTGVWLYKTANTAGTTYTNFTGGAEGNHILILVKDGNSTFDFTGSSLNWSNGVDYLAASGDAIECVHNGTNWTCAVWGANAADGNRYLAILNNTTRAPTASVNEIYPEGNVWKINSNGTESTVVHTLGAATTSAADSLAIPVTHSLVTKTTGADAEALTLANGKPGQILTIVLGTDGGGDGTLTPTTKTGFATIVFADAGDSATLLYIDDTVGWICIGTSGVAAPPSVTQ